MNYELKSVGLLVACLAGFAGFGGMAGVLLLFLSCCMFMYNELKTMLKKDGLTPVVKYWLWYTIYIVSITLIMLLATYLHPLFPTIICVALTLFVVDLDLFKRTLVLP